MIVIKVQEDGRDDKYGSLSSRWWWGYEQLIDISYFLTLDHGCPILDKKNSIDVLF